MDRTVETIKSKFGDKVIQRATLKKD
jgi:hypothetical protein